jgi:hypothetical protein
VDRARVLRLEGRKKVVVSDFNARKDFRFNGANEDGTDTGVILRECSQSQQEFASTVLGLDDQDLARGGKDFRRVMHLPEVIPTVDRNFSVPRHGFSRIDWLANSIALQGSQVPNQGGTVSAT